jgi:hypothetical protein
LPGMVRTIPGKVPRCARDEESPGFPRPSRLVASFPDTRAFSTASMTDPAPVDPAALAG